MKTARARLFPQKLQVPSPILPETKIIADRKRPQPQPVNEKIRKKPLATHPGESLRKANDERFRNPHLLKKPQTVRKRHQFLVFFLGRQNFKRMRVKRHRHRDKTEPTGLPKHLSQNFPVATMNAVEDAYRNRARLFFKP